MTRQIRNFILEIFDLWTMMLICLSFITMTFIIWFSNSIINTISKNYRFGRLKSQTQAIVLPCPFTGPKMFCAGPIFFEPAQKFIYILCQSQTFCARQKEDLHSVKSVFVPKVFEEALDAAKFLGWLKKNWTGTTYFGTCKWTRHQVHIWNLHGTAN